MLVYLLDYGKAKFYKGNITHNCTSALQNVHFSFPIFLGNKKGSY